MRLMVRGDEVPAADANVVQAIARRRANQRWFSQIWVSYVIAVFFVCLLLRGVVSGRHHGLSHWIGVGICAMFVLGQIWVIWRHYRIGRWLNAHP
jgi:hypothetical protein